MNNQSSMIEKALAAAGLPPLSEVVDTYVFRCHDQFKPLFSSGLPGFIATAVALETLRNLTASLILSLECTYPGSDSTGAGLEAFIADLREVVKRGPQTMEEVERLETQMGIEP